jgi:hypothetical protein
MVILWLFYGYSMAILWIPVDMLCCSMDLSHCSMDIYGQLYRIHPHVASSINSKSI